MIYPLVETKGRYLTHALVLNPAPRFGERKDFIFKFSRNPHVWFIRSHIRKANGTAQLYFRVEKSYEGTEMLRKILREARAAFARALVELLPIAPGALHEYEL